MRVRHCPQCHTDYRPEIATCADCGGVLEDRNEETDVFSSSGTPSAELALEQEGCSREAFEPLCRAAAARDLVPFADRLALGKVAFFIDEVQHEGRSYGFRIYVRAEERQRALAELTPLLDRGTSTVTLDLSSVEAGGAEGYTQCPACGAKLPESASACPECSLPLWEPEPQRCKTCDAPRVDDAPRCGSCGQEFDS